LAVKLFVLGRPGSGKSAAYRQILKYLEQCHRDWSAQHFSDYEILQQMFRFERLFLSNAKPRKFQPTEHGGFDVLDFSVLDKALVELEKKVRFGCSQEKDELMIIEFARDDYGRALELFRRSFLKDAYFLFINSDINSCIQRVYDRVANPTTVDDHFVSEDIIRSYYKRQRIPFKLERFDASNAPKFQVITSRMHLINNKGSQQDFAKKINRLISSIIKREERKEQEERTAILASAFTQWGHSHILVPASALKIRAGTLLGV
jgi:hypothetical protein